MVLEKTLESPLYCKEIQPVHSDLQINPGISLEGMILKLKLQYFGHLMRRVDSLEKTLRLGGIGGRRRREQQTGSKSEKEYIKTVYCHSAYLTFMQSALEMPEEIKEIILKEISPEYSLEGLIAEAEIPILWPPDAKN